MTAQIGHLHVPQCSPMHPPPLKKDTNIIMLGTATPSADMGLYLDNKG